MTLADYIASLTVTQGAGTGEPFRLLPWQRRFLRGAFAVEGDSALSIGRGNGKSTLVAALAAAVVDGPLRAPRSEVVCVASSFAQGRVIFEHVRAVLEAGAGTYPAGAGGGFKTRRTSRRSSTGRRAPGCGASVRAPSGRMDWRLSTCSPMSPRSGSRAAMLAALRTAMGKLEGSRLISLGTLPAGDDHWFAKMLDGGADFAQRHAVRSDDPPFRVRTWRKANPSLPAIPAPEARIRREAADARRDDARRPSFDALRLNLGTDDVGVSVLLEAGTWRRIEGEAPREGRPVWGLARIFHQSPAADANLHAVASRTPSSRFDVVSATPSASFGPCGPLPQAS